ncbi:MAG: HEAT repeat domain-containing protein [Actinobacteria bacterium]|mgnify:CR=1 FL=1|nr:HEAT repeat domain-containing protein [Actinomycetota bacterium]
MSPESESLSRILNGATDSVRLQAAMQAGMAPSAEYINPLVERCGVEPDFFVRDMLTWALIQHDHDQVIARVLPELDSPVAQARAQALHTLSKVGDTRTWPAITTALLADGDDEVARTAWRTAAGLVPDQSKEWLAERLAAQFGRGGRDVRLSLSQALCSLGQDSLPVIEQAMRSDHDQVRLHALTTKRILDDPDLAFDTALEQAKRVHTLRGAPLMET